LVVCVGTSTGGLSACERFLRHAPADEGLAYIVILHWDPSVVGDVRTILQRATGMAISLALGSESVEPDRVYLVLGNALRGFRAGALTADPTDDRHAGLIDGFFSSVAADRLETAVGVVLSGTGMDGAVGLGCIRSAGGLCLVQDPVTAEYDEKPRHAIDSGAADAVVAPEAMGALLSRFATAPRTCLLAREDGSRTSLRDGGAPWLFAQHSTSRRTDLLEEVGIATRHRWRRAIDAAPPEPNSAAGAEPETFGAVTGRLENQLRSMRLVVHGAAARLETAIQNQRISTDGLLRWAERLLTVHQREKAATEHERDRAESILRTTCTPLLVLDQAHNLVSASAAFFAAFQVDEDESRGRQIFELANRQWDIPSVRTLLEEVLPETGEVHDHAVEHDFEGIGWRSLRWNARVLPSEGDADLVVVSIDDVTDLLLAQREAESRAAELVVIDQRRAQLFTKLGERLREPLAELIQGLDGVAANGDSENGPTPSGWLEQTQRMTTALDQLLDLARVASGGELEPPAVAMVPRTGRPILVVADEHDAAAMMTEMLSSRGYRARSVPNEAAALRLAKELRPEVVILDAGLRETDTYEVARSLRAELGNAVRLILMTGSQPNEGFLEQAWFDGHLLKPAHPTEIFAMLEDLEGEADGGDTFSVA
jgi:chemotaxis response regulator CheB